MQVLPSFSVHIFPVHVHSLRPPFPLSFHSYKNASKKGEAHCPTLVYYSFNQGNFISVSWSSMKKKLRDLLPQQGSAASR